MKIKIIFALLLASSVMLTSCGSKQKDINEINKMQLSVDSMLSKSSVLASEQRMQTENLIKKYSAFADKYPDDSLSPQYLYEAARLKAFIPDLNGAIELYNKLADKYPPHPLAPLSLLAVAGIYDITMNDYEKAREAYTKLQQRYPKQAREYGVDKAIENLGKSPEEILEKIMLENGDTISIDAADNDSLK